MGPGAWQRPPTPSKGLVTISRFPVRRSIECLETARSPAAVETGVLQTIRYWRINPRPIQRSFMTPGSDTCPFPPASGLRLGLDMMSVKDVQASIDEFGERFVDRLFSPGEQAYALAVPALKAERLAARFAAKEAAIKAFDLSEAGVSWREMEVCCDDRGACRLLLHGKAAALAGVQEAALSFSHGRGHVIAVVLA